MLHGALLRRPSHTLLPDSAWIDEPEVGWIDLRNRRAWFPAGFGSGDFRGRVENFWDGATLYVRFAPEEPWMVGPSFGAADWPLGSIPYSSPLWLLDALRGAPADASVVASETLRGVETTRIRLTLNPAIANAASPAGLWFPALPTDTFPAEVWVDNDGRLRRVSYSWPTRPRLLGRHGSWNTTELWDFGTATTSPSIDELPRPGTDAGELRG
jgi:hypothetical protein